jgi:Uma2 family endonuclease
MTIGVNVNEAVTTLKPIRREVPPLQTGDRLTRSEFERRYHAMPHVKKAELIEGVVFMPSPVRHIDHGKPHLFFSTLIGTYIANTPGIDGSDNATVRLDPDNEPQPDVLLRLETKDGGFSDVDADGYIEGSPELIVEISASTASYDMHDKFKIYRRNGVKEYIIWRVYDDEIDWFRLEKESYVPLLPDAEGIIRSQIFPGLQLDVQAMLKGDLARVLTVLQHGVGTAEHQAFVARLAPPAQD